MRTILLVGRLWQLHLGLAAAAACCLVARRWWHIDASVPGLERAVPMPAMLPALLALALGWVLVERWPEQLATASRPAPLLLLTRYVAVTALGTAAAGASAGTHDPEVIQLVLIGIGLAGVAGCVVGRWWWVPVVLAGYGWLHYRVQHLDEDFLGPSWPLAAIAYLAAAVAYAFVPAIQSCAKRPHGPSPNPDRRLG